MAGTRDGSRARGARATHQSTHESVVGETYLFLRSLAAYSGMSIRMLRAHLVHLTRPLPHYRVGGKILVRRTEYHAWTQQFRVTASTDLAAIVDDVIAEVR